MIPRYVISVDGDVKNFATRLVNLTLSDKIEDDADTLNLTFVDHDGALALPRLGAEISLSLGFENAALVAKGTFIADSISYSGTPDLLTIKARAANFSESLDEARDQSWRETTLGDILHTIAGRNGLQLVSTDEVTSKTVAHLDQFNESDAEFVQRLARLHDHTVSIKDRRLICLKRGEGKRASGQALPLIVIERTAINRHRFEEGRRENSHTGVIAFWHNPSTSMRREEIIGKKGKTKRLPDTYASADLAKAAATSEWRRLQRGKRRLSLTLAIGRPEIIAESPVQVRGIKSDIDATNWIAQEVTHRLNEQGYITSLKLEVRQSA